MSEKNSTSKVFGCVCEGTGIDPTFQDKCKCQDEMAISEITEKQAKFLADLTREIKTIMKVDLTWADVTTKKQASEVIDLLKGVKSMALILKVKKAQGKVTADQVETIRGKINAKPTTEWVQKATKKLVTL